MRFNFEIEITEDIIKEQIDQKIKETVKTITDGMIKSYSTERKIKDCIDSYFDIIIREIVNEEFKNKEKIQEKVREVLTKKINSQLTALMKNEK
jgi:hypothetical protein